MKLTYFASMCVYAPESRRPSNGRQSYMNSMPLYCDESALIDAVPPVSETTCVMISSLKKTMNPTN